jgi:hypothetical protein
MTIPKINIHEAKQKTLKTGLNMTHLIIIGTVIYGLALTNSNIDFKQVPVIAQAQEITLDQSIDEIVQTAEIEPLKVRNESTSDTETASIRTDRATKLNDWIKAKEPNSPLNNANHDTGKILIEIETETKVKAEFILAKAYQETKLGTAGVCKRNVGSVGETDSNRRLGKFCQDFRSDNQKASIDRMEHYQTDDYLYKSLRAIAGTVNNSLLGNSTVLCQLARGYKGCTDEQIRAMKGKWYAYNTDHAQSVASILSDITGQNIDLQYEFKIK